MLLRDAIRVARWERAMSDELGMTDDQIEAIRREAEVIAENRRITVMQALALMDREW